MKKIRSIQQLKKEKFAIQRRKQELEKAIRYDWRDLKDDLRPKNIAGNIVGALFEKQPFKKNDSVIAERVATMTAGFTRKLVNDLEEKAGKWAKKNVLIFRSKDEN